MLLANSHIVLHFHRDFSSPLFLWLDVAHILLKVRLLGLDLGNRAFVIEIGTLINLFSLNVLIGKILDCICLAVRSTDWRERLPLTRAIQKVELDVNLFVGA